MSVTNIVANDSSSWRLNSVSRLLKGAPGSTNISKAYQSVAQLQVTKADLPKVRNYKVEKQTTSQEKAKEKIPSKEEQEEVTPCSRASLERMFLEDLKDMDK